MIGLHFGRHHGYIKILNDARVASLGLFKDNVNTNRINKEKVIKFQVFLKFVQMIADYGIRGSRGSLTASLGQTH